MVDYLKQQSWVETNKLILLGHSQGAHVAAHMAMGNSDIYAVGYFSGNPMGRFSEMVLKERRSVQQGQISADSAQNNINTLYKAWRAICSDDYPDNISSYNVRQC